VSTSRAAGPPPGPAGGQIRLPDFPWDALAPYAALAAGHPGGLVDLSVGTPVDPTPELARAALAAAADAPGYPPTAGTGRFRRAAAGWLGRRLQAPVDPAAVLPTIGSKELVASLPSQLGLGAGRAVAVPSLAYPTYEVGAVFAGAPTVRVDDVTDLDPAGVGLVWVNSPANPDGAVLGTGALARLVAWARRTDPPVVVASDECYAEFGWEEPAVSVLDPRVHGGRLDGLLAVHSLSKRSNLAGYRVGFVAGDPGLVQHLLRVRRHAGLIVPGPVQAAATAVLDDDEHADAQRQRYLRRRAVLRPAFAAAGFRVEASAGGLYLWVTAGEDCWASLGRLAEVGILTAPGSFYGPAGERHLRVALTATDERVFAAAGRLAELRR
jgi:succinyldiaminopimelate transaminase